MDLITLSNSRLPVRRAEKTHRKAQVFLLLSVGRVWSVESWLPARAVKTLLHFTESSLVVQDLPLGSQ